MSFAPALPLGGIAGWALLQRVEGAQRDAFARRPDVARDAAHFADRIAEVDTPAKLVADRRLLTVALGAFGLEGEVGKRAVIRRVLESDPADRTSFAGRQLDPRWKALAEAFGFGSAAGPRTADPGFAARITDRFRERAYETALGEADPAMRLALNARRELAAYAEARDPDRAGWFQVLSDRPVRQVLEKAFGLPAEFGKLDVDRQREVFRSRTRNEFGDGSLKVFADPANVDKLIRRFLAREAAEAGPGPTQRGVAALTILTAGSGMGPLGFGNLIQSRFG